MDGLSEMELLVDDDEGEEEAEAEEKQDKEKHPDTSLDFVVPDWIKFPLRSRSTSKSSVS